MFPSNPIIDGATTRRTVPTANAKWGNGLAVLLGDALFSHALKLSTNFDDLDLSRAISQASRLLQLASLSFDVAAAEIAIAFATGAALVLMREEARSASAPHCARRSHTCGGTHTVHVHSCIAGVYEQYG